MPFLKYRDNDSCLRPSSYPYILGRALNQYRINTSVTIYILNLPIICRYMQIGMILLAAVAAVADATAVAAFAAATAVAAAAAFSVAAAVAAAIA